MTKSLAKSAGSLDSAEFILSERSESNGLRSMTTAVAGEIADFPTQLPAQARDSRENYYCTVKVKSFPAPPS